MAEPAVDPLDEQAAQLVSGMSLEDKVAQMFVITPEALTGYTSVTAAGDTTKTAYESIHHPAVFPTAVLFDQGNGGIKVAQGHQRLNAILQRSM